MMKTFRPFLVVVISWVAVVLGVSPSHAGDDDFVRVVLERRGPTPFSMVKYEITKRAPATTAVHRRLLPGYPESLHALALMTKEESATIDQLIVASNAMTLRDDVPKKLQKGTLVWRVELLVDGRSHTFRIADPENHVDRRYQRLIDGIRRQVTHLTGPLPFRNVFFSPKQRGWLNVQSVPSAQLFVAGIDTKLTTPVYSYEVPAGVHEVRLVSKEHGLDRTYKVTVEAGGTTNARIDLR